MEKKVNLWEDKREQKHGEIVGLAIENDTYNQEQKRIRGIRTEREGEGEKEMID